MTEATLTRRILKALRNRGAYAIKVHATGSRVGAPDIVGCDSGDFFALEVKLPERRGRVTKIQKQNMEEIRAAGGIAKVVTSVEEAIEALEENCWR